MQRAKLSINALISSGIFHKRGRLKTDPKSVRNVEKHGKETKYKENVPSEDRKREPRIIYTNFDLNLGFRYEKDNT